MRDAGCGERVEGEFQAPLPDVGVEDHLPGVADRAMGAGLLHGTHVASLIFGQHHSAVHGVAPKCRGVLIPIFREQQDGLRRSAVRFAGRVRIVGTWC